MINHYNKTDEYYIFIFNKLMDLAPIIGSIAAITFTIARILGYFTFTEYRYLLVFDIICISYFILAYKVRKFGIIRNGKVDNNSIQFVGIILDLIIILQWNLITYIFPTESFWGFAPMFVLLSAFLFQTKIVLFNIIGISISIATSWLLIGDKLLPVGDELFIENVTLRIAALVISFIVIYILTMFSEKFAIVANQNFKTMENQNNELENTNKDIIDFTADIIEERDAVSGSHVKRLKKFTKLLATEVSSLYPEYGLTEEIIEEISLASVLHDIGKIAIPDNILLKPGKLTPEEFNIIKTHTVLGVKIIDKLPESVGYEYKNLCIEICKYHHEKYDGKGYPNGLKGDDIPISAQIVSVVDCYDALTSKRPYKNALPGELAIQMILNGDCGAFSDKLLKCLVLCKESFLSV